MAETLNIFGIHGLGDHRTAPWKEEWKAAIDKVFPDQTVDRTYEYFEYDEYFEDVDISAVDVAKAFGKLVGSGISGIFGRKRGIFDALNEKLRWYAGYVVAWVENKEFRRKLQKELTKRIAEVKPDVILAHSLGSLISYDTLVRGEFPSDLAKFLKEKIYYVSLGAQIANPFVVGNLYQGRVQPLNVKHWFHLYNSEDDIFTAPITLPGVENFLQVNTYFDVDGWEDHGAVHYLEHRATVTNVWGPIASSLKPQRRAQVGFTATMENIRALRKPSRKPRRRALLVGIDEYPDPAARLEGCVNDVFEMSAVLQECNFDAGDIRICLNERATAEGIRQRLAWLLDDPLPGDELVFYYSGHGARLPTYGEGDDVDQMDESLVPHDFDWSPETCVTDDQIYCLYSQLPYDTRLVMIFDCCHSGGMHRNPNRKVRGIDPPDDIRHRAMVWNAKEQMWEDRELPPITANFTNDAEAQRLYMGESGSVKRLGRAMILRKDSAKEYEKKKAEAQKENVAFGPYLPVIIQACQEYEYAYEYRHGAQSYGAFTFALTRTLRNRKQITFNALVDQTAQTLARLRYDQTPTILGPNVIREANVPFQTGSKPRTSRKKKAKKS